MGPAARRQVNVRQCHPVAALLALLVLLVAAPRTADGACGEWAGGGPLACGMYLKHSGGGTYA